MSSADSAVLVINPGSTSTKFGVFSRACALWTCSLHHSDTELNEFLGRSALAQAEYRAALITSALKSAGYGDFPFSAVAGRGGLLPPMEAGTYIVDDAMIEELRLARRGEHACNLGAVLARRFAQAAGVEAYIVDPVSVDQWQPCARISGSPLAPRSAIGHALNTRAVAHRFAAKCGRQYEELRLIVVHMGSGVTVSAHCDGRMIDNNSPEEGPFGPDRSGSLPVRELIKAACSGAFTEKQLDRKVFGEGGLFAYLGTRDVREVLNRINAGDSQAEAVFNAMIYQIGKETGAMAAALHGKVDAVLLTGGMAWSDSVVASLRPFIEWIAPVVVYPGEDELLALAQGVFRVLDQEERPRHLWEDGRIPAEARALRTPLVVGME